eukprot:366782-Hanusia_phi.AAC.2
MEAVLRALGRKPRTFPAHPQPGGCTSSCPWRAPTLVAVRPQRKGVASRFRQREHVGWARVEGEARAMGGGWSNVSAGNCGRVPLTVSSARTLRWRRNREQVRDV